MLSFFVMLQKKCEQYWPLETGSILKFGDISVSLISAEITADHSVNQLSVTKVFYAISIMVSGALHNIVVNNKEYNSLITTMIKNTARRSDGRFQVCSSLGECERASLCLPGPSWP